MRTRMQMATKSQESGADTHLKSTLHWRKNTKSCLKLKGGRCFSVRNYAYCSCISPELCILWASADRAEKGNETVPPSKTRKFWRHTLFSCVKCSKWQPWLKGARIIHTSLKYNIMGIYFNMDIFSFRCQYIRRKLNKWHQFVVTCLGAVATV